MKRLATILIVWELVGCAGWAGEPSGGGRMVDVVAGNNAFACDLYAGLAREPVNLFFSPYSLSTGLAMTYAGARGETAAQMAKTLHLTLPRDQLDPAIRSLVRQINGDGGSRPFELAVANALWAQRGLTYDADFLGRLERYYGAGLQLLDFNADPEAARRAINAWVEQQTRDKIRELLAAGVVSRETELVLTNAVYFKGRWRHPFAKRLTEEGDFFRSETAKTRTPLMHQRARLPYADGPEFQALELPYAGDELSLLVLLPKDRDGMPALERGLRTALTVRTAPREVDVTLPRFKLATKFKLNDTLSALGMPLAFSGAADFSGMNGRGGIAISAVIHEAFIDVNEEGTEAAAATGVVVTRSTAAISPFPPVVFRADHPFLIAIREVKTGCVLFLGRVTSPN